MVFYSGSWNCPRPVSYTVHGVIPELEPIGCLTVGKLSRVRLSDSIFDRSFEYSPRDVRITEKTRYLDMTNLGDGLLWETPKPEQRETVSIVHVRKTFHR